MNNYTNLDDNDKPFFVSEELEGRDLKIEQQKLEIAQLRDENAFLLEDNARCTNENMELKAKVSRGMDDNQLELGLNILNQMEIASTNRRLGSLDRFAGVLGKLVIACGNFPEKEGE